MNFEDIFVVIVLYKNSLENSRTLDTFGRYLDFDVDLFVYDNTPDEQYSKDNFKYKSFNINYFHDYRNLGLSKAYNFAMELAKNRKKSWLLLLDQDTSFSKEYIEKILTLDKDSLVDNVVAIIPKVKTLDDSKIISPGKMLVGGICRPAIIESGIVNAKITGINSGTILNLKYLQEIDGFSESYSLDMLDHWYFRKIYNDKKNVFLLDVTINQDLSVIENFEEKVSFARYRQMVAAESLFMKSESFTSIFVFKLRLISRALKQLNFKNKKYFNDTLKSIFTI